MLFSSKKLSNRLQFKAGDTTATLDGQLLDLAKVTHFFKHEFRQFTNGVYEYDELKLVLLFDNKTSAIALNIITLTARSHDQPCFTLLHQLSDQLEPLIDSHAAAKLLANGKLTFPLDDETQQLEISNQTLSLVAGNPRRTFTVTSVNMVSNASQPYFIFNGTNAMGAQKLRLSPAAIANISVLMDQIIALKLLQEAPPRPQWQQKLTKILPKVGIPIVLLLALNGYFKIFTSPDWLEGISILSMIMSSVWIAVVPMYWVVHKINIKRIDKVDRRK